MAQRVGVASIIQETNTFAANRTTMRDFEIQGIWIGADTTKKSQGMNIEVAGSLARLTEHGFDSVAVMRAWALAGGIFLDSELAKMKSILKEQLLVAGKLDGIILDDHTDAHLTEFVRDILGPDVPIVVTHDLHGNPSRRIVTAADAVIGFRTYPHIDQGDTGRRAADLMKEILMKNRRLGTVLKKLNMIIPAETMGTSDQPLVEIRRLADSLIDDEILDISLFPVQPWIDVAEVGFGISVVHSGNVVRANECAIKIRDALWHIHKDFQLTLCSVESAISQAIQGYRGKMQLISQSSDAPSGGSTGDDSRLIAALIAHKSDIPSACTVVDAPAVGATYLKEIGDEVSLLLGFTIDPRWGQPVNVNARLKNKGNTPVVLTGPVMTGQVVSVGRWVVLETLNKVQILVTESATTTFDPAGYEFAGIDLATCTIVQVRSPLLFKSGFAGRYGQSFSLNLDGPTTPSVSKLEFHKVPRPMIGLDKFSGDLLEVCSD